MQPERSTLTPFHKENPKRCLLPASPLEKGRTSSVKFKAKKIEYREGFSNGGTIERKGGGRYGTIRFRGESAIVSWDDGEKVSYPSIEVLKNWGLIEPVPWFIAGQTVAIVPRPDGSISRECEYRVVSTDGGWIEARQIAGDRTIRCPIPEFPGFPFRNDVAIKQRPLLPIPQRFTLELAAGEYIWGKKLSELVGRKLDLYELFKKDLSEPIAPEEILIRAWEGNWTFCCKHQAREFGHGGKKIGSLIRAGEKLDRIVDFDAETFEFVTDGGVRFSLLQSYLHPNIEIQQLTPHLYVLQGGDFIEARLGFNGKEGIKRSKAKVKKLTGCKDPIFIPREFSTCKYEWVLSNPFKKADVFAKHLQKLAKEFGA